MNSLVNYNSDDDAGDADYNSRQFKNEDANYDDVGMEESSEESNNNHSDSGQACSSSRDIQQPSPTSTQHLAHEKDNARKEDIQRDKDKSENNVRNFNINVIKGKKDTNEQDETVPEETKANYLGQKKQFSERSNSKSFEQKRRNSSDMDMDDEDNEEDLSRTWHQGASHGQNSRGSNNSSYKNKSDEQDRLHYDAAREEHFSRSAKESKVNEDEKKREERKKEADVRRERDTRDSDDRRRDKESERDRDKRRDTERDRDRSRRDDRDKRRSPDRREYSRKRSHSPERRDRDRDRRSPKKYIKRNSPDRNWRTRKLVEKKKEVLSKLGIELKPSPIHQMTPQQLLGEQLKTQIQEVEAKTGITLPNYYNPGVMNPMKYAQQIQKRKLLWGNKANENKTEAEPPTATKQWQAATFKGDNDGKMTEKFKRLMGIKCESGGQAVASCSTPAAISVYSGNEPSQTKEIIEKQEEMFSNMEAQYQVARMATHTHRGIGLGFGTFQVPPR